MVVTVGVAWTDGFQAYLVLWGGITIMLFAISHAILGNLEDHEE
jgi:hypothetical protein